MSNDETLAFRMTAKAEVFILQPSISSVQTKINYIDNKNISVHNRILMHMTRFKN